MCLAPQDLTKLTFTNHSVALGSSAGQYSTTATPTIAQVQSLTTTLATKVDNRTYNAGLSSKANATDVQTSAPANALFTDTVSQILHNGNYLPGKLVSYTNARLGFGSTTGQVTVTCQPIIAEVEAGALTTALAAKAPKSDTCTKTEVQGFLNTKANKAELLKINTTSTRYEKITLIAFSNGSISKTGTSATV